MFVINCPSLFTHTHTHTHIPWICKVVMATIACEISHKDTKLMDKCNNNKTKTTQKQNDKTTDKYFFQNIVKITQKKKD
jgi:hypothetical protein